MKECNARRFVEKEARAKNASKVRKGVAKSNGNRFVSEALKKKSCLAIVNRKDINYPKSKQIKVDNTCTLETIFLSIKKRILLRN